MTFAAEHRSLDHIFDPVWSAAKLSRPKNNINVTGGSRFLFFENPKITSKSSSVPILEFKLAPNVKNDRIECNIISRKTKTIGIQTSFRDSETQTDPYSPDITVDGMDEKNKLEILSLQNLTYGHGLPATKVDISRIIRARERREEGALLPPITDERTALIHKKFLEDQEVKDFKIREEELNEEINSRMESFKNEIKPMKTEYELKLARRLEYIQREAKEKANAKKSKLKGKIVETQKNLMASSFSTRLSDSFEKNCGLHDYSNGIHLNAKKNQNKCDRNSETDGINSENIAALEKIVQREGLDVFPKRPKINDPAVSSMNRKALSLAANLHLWNGLIQNENAMI